MRALFLPLLYLILLATRLEAAEPFHAANDAALQAWSAHAQTMKPTVTAEMGDRGGKSFGEVPDPAKTRHYYIAAELDTWDFAPESLDPVCGMAVPPHVKNAHTAIKVRYFQYTDETFTAKVLQTPRLGILGPVLRGVVGETLAVTFLNRTKFPLSMHPHGVKYDKDSEGAFYHPAPGLGAAVGPQARFTYMWKLDEAAGPQPWEPSSKCWLYHSHVSGDEESNLGLVGFIIVTDPARARPDGTPNDVDREMASLFMIFNESGAGDDDDEAPPPGVDATPDGQEPTWAWLQEQRELGSRYAINGRIYGNLTGLEMNEGERVRWYLFGLGDEVDMHTAHWHGMRVMDEGRRRTDVVELLPATMKIADAVADNPGDWLYHCHVAEHMTEGMFTRMSILPKGGREVSRAPEVAFFGMPEAKRSLRFDRAEMSRETQELRLHGVVSVYEFFSIAKAPVRFQIGEKVVTFTPAQDGTANAEGVSYRVLGGGQWGVIYGEQMEIQVTVRGAAWMQELAKLGLPATAPAATELPLRVELEIGGTKHTGTTRVTVHQGPLAPLE